MRSLKRRLASALLRVLRRAFRSRAVGVLDVFFAYRLLLLRNPDDDGWVHYLAAARRRSLSLRSLSDDVLRSPEFAALRGTPGGGGDHDTQPVEEQLLEVEGFKIVVDRHDAVIGRAIARGEYEPATAAIFRELLRPGDTAADVGANVGFFTLLAARCVTPSGRVFAFEPMPQNHDLLAKSVALNGLSNVTLSRVALLDEARHVEFIQWERRNSGSFHVLNDGTWEGPRYPVQAQTFDAVFTGTRLDLVKIDVEGAEGLVFDGMQRSLERFRPVVVFEYAPSAIADLSRREGKALLAAFEARGYALVEVHEYLNGRRRMRAAQLARALRAAGDTHIDLIALPG